jgi:hypothetical protein
MHLLEASLTVSWPPLETFEETPAGWTDQNGNAFTKVTQCGKHGQILGGYYSLTQDGRLAKTYTVRSEEKLGQGKKRGKHERAARLDGPFLSFIPSPASSD